jgi:zinc resistance-associated protein
MKRWIVGLGALGALVSAGALAQEGPHGHGPYGGARFEHGTPPSPEDRAAFTDARVAALHAGLKLTPDQEKLWPPVEQAIRNLAKERQDAMAQRRERFAAMRDQTERNIPDQLRFMADRQAASADALRKLADASAPLYAALDDSQKHRLTVLARGIMGPGGGMHRHHHHHDRG